MPDPTAVIAGALRDRTAKAIGEHLSERALLRPDADDEAKAWAVLIEEIEEENRRIVLGGHPPLASEVKESVATLLYDGLFGLGPLQKYIDDPDVEEVIVNGAESAFMALSFGGYQPSPSSSWGISMSGLGALWEHRQVSLTTVLVSLDVDFR